MNQSIWPEVQEAILQDRHIIFYTTETGDIYKVTRIYLETCLQNRTGCKQNSSGRDNSIGCITFIRRQSIGEVSKPGLFYF